MNKHNVVTLVRSEFRAMSKKARRKLLDRLLRQGVSVRMLAI